MPTKWTPERDQTLLLKILETSSISADVKAISENWPAGEEAPTPRAIQERLHKIRAMAKGKGTGTFKMVGTVGSKAGSANSSPTKRTPRGTPKKNGKQTPKRKRAAKDDDGIEDSEHSDPGFKSENNGTDASDDESSKVSPAKKVKTEAVDGASDAFDINSFSMPHEI
ncbi:MAG: hypothetical protein Q9219_000606 [cf. Caloplaca sp. 3 TL-2023]